MPESRRAALRLCPPAPAIQQARQEPSPAPEKPPVSYAPSLLPFSRLARESESRHSFTSPRSAQVVESGTAALDRQRGIIDHLFIGHGPQLICNDTSDDQTSFRRVFIHFVPMAIRRASGHATPEGAEPTCLHTS